MRFAVTIRCAESKKRRDATHSFTYHGSPIVFTAIRIMRKPDIFETCRGTQVIDMPATTPRPGSMPSSSSLDAAWSKRTSHVNVEARTYRQFAEAPNSNSPCFRRCEHERIRSRAGCQRRMSSHQHFSRPANATRHLRCANAGVLCRARARRTPSGAGES